MANTPVDNASQGPARCSMLAWRVHDFGPPEAMILERVPRPDPGPGEVLVDVHAAGVGPWDGWIRAGKSTLPQPLPLTLGSDLSGTIAAVGSGISEMAVGDQVFGVTNTQFLGAYAEYAVASAGMLAKKPSSLSYAEAASVPVVAVTAWQGLFDHARLEAGQTESFTELGETSEPTRSSSLVALACVQSRRRGPGTSSTCDPSVPTRYWTITRNASRMR
jgi:D-arabinose 1-dehydrogenase-like Zn-dependent alcohol dehydrogenase